MKAKLNDRKIRNWIIFLRIDFVFISRYMCIDVKSFKVWNCGLRFNFRNQAQITCFAIYVCTSSILHPRYTCLYIYRNELNKKHVVTYYIGVYMEKLASIMYTYKTTHAITSRLVDASPPPLFSNIHSRMCAEHKKVYSGMPIFPGPPPMPPPLYNFWNSHQRAKLYHRWTPWFFLVVL